MAHLERLRFEAVEQHEPTSIIISDIEWEAAAALKREQLEAVEAESQNKEKTIENQQRLSKERMGAERGEGAAAGVEQASCLPSFAFYLPNLERLPPDFRTFLERDLIETPTQRRLENSRHLNWWHTIGQRLWPLSTTGDGNCLLHAASLGMWGLHDRQLMLRNALYEILLRGSRRNALWRRWKWAETKANEAAGLRLTEEEWATEWNNVVSLAAPTPRKNDEASSSSSSSDQIYEGLEAIHVFALAHVLKRPIVVVSDTVLRNASGEELSPIGFGGVYLPLECPPEQCHRSPLVLCYDSAHFSPLVSMRDQSSLQQIIPVTDVNRNLLPLHFAVDPGPDFTWWKDEDDNRMAAQLEPRDADCLACMSEYMDLIRIDVRHGSVRRTTPIRRDNGAQPVAPSSPISSPSTKSLTLASTGVTPPSSSGHHEKKRILNEITQQVRRTLRLTSSKQKENALDAKACLEALSRTNCFLAARLNAISHEYMEKMAKDYIKVAQERFHNSKGRSNGKTRLGRSFSASSLLSTCINRHCTEPASQATNFFCSPCFERQKALLTSFSSDGSSNRNAMRRIITHGCPFASPSSSSSSSTFQTPSMSSTMPSLSSARSERSPSGHARSASGTHSNWQSSPVDGHAIVLDVISGRGATCTSQPLTAVADANGVTHYYIPDADNNPTLPATTIIPPHSTVIALHSNSPSHFSAASNPSNSSSSPNRTVATLLAH